MVLLVPFMNVRGEDQSAPKDILNNMIYSCIIFQGNEIVCQVTNYIISRTSQKYIHIVTDV